MTNHLEPGIYQVDVASGHVDDTGTVIVVNADGWSFVVKADALLPGGPITPAPSLRDMRAWLAADPEHHRIEADYFTGWDDSHMDDDSLAALVSLPGADPDAPHPGYRLTTIEPELGAWTRATITTIKASQITAADRAAIRAALDELDTP